MAKIAPNILFCAQNDLRYIMPPQFSPNQITASPFIEDREKDGRLRHLVLPMGEFDIADIIAKIPAGQRPDLLVVKTDAFLNIEPRGVGHLNIPKIMICGDTQHGANPLRNILAYAESEPYDAYVIDHTRHHLHWYREAGLANVHWIPGMLVRDWQLDTGGERPVPFSFVGQVSDNHVRRKKAIAELRKTDLPFSVLAKPQRYASEIYAMSRMTLNQSLNGDLNLRVFEALLAGPCLLTDRLSRQSGLEILFEPDRELVLYNDTASMIEMARALLIDEPRTTRIGQAGQRKMRGPLHPARLHQTFVDLALSGKAPSFDAGHGDPRAGGASEPKHLDRRLAIYQVLQHHYRIRDSMSVFCDTCAMPELLSDAADLPQLTLAAVPGLQSHARQMDIADRVRLVERAAGRRPSGPWTFVITDCDGTAVCAQPNVARAIIVADYAAADATRQEQIQTLMQRRGYLFSLADPAGVFGREAIDVSGEAYEETVLGLVGRGNATTRRLATSSTVRKSVGIGHGD